MVQKEMEAQLQSRMVKYMIGKGILRWGQEGDGNFKFQQSYMLGVEVDLRDKPSLWKKVWNI
jgi:hypothetical protein